MENSSIKVRTANCEKLIGYIDAISNYGFLPKKKKLLEDLFPLDKDELPDIVFLQEVSNIVNIDKDLPEKTNDEKEILIKEHQVNIDKAIDNIEAIFISFFEERYKDKTYGYYLVYFHTNYQIFTIVNRKFAGKFTKNISQINSMVYDKFFLKSPFRLKLNSLVKLRDTYKENTKKPPPYPIAEDPLNYSKTIRDAIYNKSEPRIYPGRELLFKRQNSALFVKDIFRSVLNEKMFMQYFESEKNIVVLVNIHLVAYWSQDFEKLEILNVIEDEHFTKALKSHSENFSYGVFYQLLNAFLEFLREFLRNIHEKKKVHFIMGGDFNRTVVPEIHDNLSIFKNVKSNALNNSITVRTLFVKNSKTWAKYMYTAVKLLLRLKQTNNKDIPDNSLRKILTDKQRELVKTYLLKDGKVVSFKEEIITNLYNNYYKYYKKKFNKNKEEGMVKYFQQCYYSESFDNILYNFSNKEYELDPTSVNSVFPDQCSEMTRQEYNAIIGSSRKLKIEDDIDKKAAKKIVIDMVYYYLYNGKKSLNKNNEKNPNHVDPFVDSPYASDHNAVEATFNLNKKTVVMKGVEESKEGL